ncbi:hypothetical protein NK55_09460 [Thermosynechococcus sp. NK55a]|jgi:hypothetical protein|uniref:hypothetical protein n=1 Tax=unclassified Thermosynechococcus TaxID=2622553 RepID=UPI0003D92796|nr:MULTISPECIES: hypothetical protein [unclassified Thermosynechococcus]AHB89150.1 hypothetical protein NK55_09460 [Thermosynechococcus sp. NK55a]RMD82011.1 MAG: hypothetical protein D6823_01670 [Chloroflexota bacterium]HIK22291.1 hypothetical protein [Thermosynechococcus sp. M3746_W2019_013]
MTDAVAVLFQQGQEAFERGNYQQSVALLGQAAALAEGNAVQSGEISLWLVTAYSAAGDQGAAVSLCRQLQRHPDPHTRQESRRLLAILEAPQLKRRPEWYSEIPDLSHLGDRSYTSPNRRSSKRPSAPTPKPQEPPPPATPLPNAFIWIALTGLGVATLLVAWL